MHICIYICMHVCMHVICMYMYVCMYACMYVCICKYAYVYVRSQQVYLNLVMPYITCDLARLIS